ncbi:DUF6250 domain-containing protein [Tamlana sp. 2201CG12-4]|uniref:DUF6250 domain-containing protein n=1 Tax=Tamlana sp. 2201CG12-4 TaxID=3112582 RepID=UPI002DBB7F6F|nr:DUF6250 domain-containing protein [Tamlana sp. 2201CG12-4]MEC3908839.1 DUF6250 domain-containing protein [Tamlana sp. 2201CG12-4]
MEKVIYSGEIIRKKNWVVEQQPGGTVTFNSNIIEINDAKGCTLWLKYKLEGPVKIEYDVTVIDEGGKYDRVSDLNCFWMANDPKNRTDFFKNSKNRNGKFSNYHELTQYYVGYGGHNNSKTRFRRYNGNIERPLLPEHDLDNSEFMITANKMMHITLIAKGNDILYLRNGEVIFKLYDPEPYTSGYFGFRTVNNHMIIKGFKVSEIH